MTKYFDVSTNLSQNDVKQIINIEFVTKFHLNIDCLSPFSPFRQTVTRANATRRLVWSSMHNT